MTLRNILLIQGHTHICYSRKRTSTNVFMSDLELCGLGFCCFCQCLTIPDGRASGFSFHHNEVLRRLVGHPINHKIFLKILDTTFLALMSKMGTAIYSS